MLFFTFPFVNAHLLSCIAYRHRQSSGRTGGAPRQIEIEISPMHNIVIESKRMIPPIEHCYDAIIMPYWYERRYSLVWCGRAELALFM